MQWVDPNVDHALKVTQEMDFSAIDQTVSVHPIHVFLMLSVFHLRMDFLVANVRTITLEMEQIVRKKLLVIPKTLASLGLNVSLWAPKTLSVVPVPIT